MLPVRIGVAIVGVLGVFSPAAGIPADVDAVRLWRAPDHTRWCWTFLLCVLYLVHPENPDRFVVDLAKSQLKTPLSSLPLEGTPILQVRSGVRKGTDLRLVFDLVEKVRTSVFILLPTNLRGIALSLTCLTTRRWTHPSRF
ncbi:MAG: hypothetical protein CM15mP89_3160 [Gammaproteobacteria bacterium]|nr:MAG: hypothetical protein CM15mP89_3160 [Gammaproteobacteria bacterium]